MALETWLAFIVASAALIAVPGPTVLMLVGYGLARGRAIAFVTIPGVALGAGLSMSMGVLGLGAILATSAMLFTILKFVGAAYLIWLGISMWRAPVSEGGMGNATPQLKERGTGRVFFHAFAVTALNPKLVAFHMAFLPQFIDPTAPLMGQAVIMAFTFISVSAVLDTTYALAAGSAREALKKPSLLRLANRIGGTALIGAGAAMAAMRRAT
ncbi:MAG: LysE family translocator [Pseudomonadota bacterium]